MCHYGWFNKEQNGHYLGRKRLDGTSVDRENSERKKVRVISQMWKKQDGQYRVKITEQC